MRTDRGFTLLELLIVVVIIATIAAVAIPSLLRSRMAANETAAVACLKTLLTEQTIFTQQGEVDQDDDGKGELGWLCELSGEVCVRKPAVTPDPMPIYSPYISQGFASGGASGNGCAEKSGYLFRLYLPFREPTGVPDDAGDDTCADGTQNSWGTELDSATDRRIINLQENCFVTQAWPAQSGVSGSRCFVVNETGTICGSKMRNVTYSGTISPMADYRLCFRADGNGNDGWWNDPLATGAEGIDGNLYNPVE